jgi:hypothetical protein
MTDHQGPSDPVRCRLHEYLAGWNPRDLVVDVGPTQVLVWGIDSENTVPIACASGAEAISALVFASITRIPSAAKPTARLGCRDACASSVRSPASDRLLSCCASWRLGYSG